MRVRPVWWIGVVILLCYAAWVAGVWLFRDLDYRSIFTEANLIRGVIQPLGIAALALAAFNTMAGWWHATLREVPRLRRPAMLCILLLVMGGFIVISLALTSWSAISTRHLAVMAVAMLLVGFCEEMLTRGILLVSLRGSLKSEAWAWFGSTALFGLLHASNALFGVGPMALVQVLLAFCVGTGLYLLRRLGGTLLLPMLVHALWDFASLGTGLAQTPPNLASFGLLIATYLLSLVLVFVILRGEGARAEGRVT